MRKRIVNIAKNFLSILQMKVIFYLLCKLQKSQQENNNERKYHRHIHRLEEVCFAVSHCVRHRVNVQTEIKEQKYDQEKRNRTPISHHGIPSGKFNIVVLHF